MSGGHRVITGALHRERRSEVTFRGAPLAQPPASTPPVPRIAKMLALAHHIQRAIDAGRVPNRAAVAARLGLTRARVTQVLDLLQLAPDIQEVILCADLLPGVGSTTERLMRGIVRDALWGRQRRRWRLLASAGQRVGRRARLEVDHPTHDSPHL